MPVKYGLGRVLKSAAGPGDGEISQRLLGQKPIYFWQGERWGRWGWSVLAFALATYWKVTGQKDYIQTPLPVDHGYLFVLAVLLVLIGLLARDGDAPAPRVGGPEDLRGEGEDKLLVVGSQ